ASYQFTATTNRTLVANFSTLRITSPFLPVGSVGIPYSATFTATGGTGSYTWSLTQPAPPGLSLHPSTGVFSGTPTARGSYAVWVQVSSNGQTDAIGVSLTVSGVGITTTSLPSGTQGVSYAATVSVIGGSGNYRWSYLGDPPPPGL